MNLFDINPYIRIAMQSELVSPCYINRRIILDYELLYVEDGEFILTYNEKEYICKKGNIILLCPNIPHSFSVVKYNITQPHIHFDIKYDTYSENVFVCFKDYPDLSSSEKAMIRKNLFQHLRDNPIIKISDKENFLKFFYNIIYSKDYHSLSSKANMLNLLEMIISENATDEFVHTTATASVATLVKAYIDSNYQQDFQLCDLERQFGYSKFYIEKLFKHEFQISIIQYRNNKRLSEAIELLKKYSVSNTSQMLGYSSIYAFSRSFRMAFGVSPTKYIEKFNDHEQ